MSKRGAIRYAFGLIAALALASLLLLLVSSDDAPASLNLPPFEQEVYLSVTAKWAPDDCVDVAVITNLPRETVYLLAAQPRPRKPRSGSLPFPMDRLVVWTESLPFAVQETRMDHSGIFCGLVRARRDGRPLDTNGLLLAVSVGRSAHYYWKNLQTVQANAKQELRVGRNGSALRGPLTDSRTIDGRTRTVSRSKTFILEPLPMLPEEEESEEESEDE